MVVYVSMLFSQYVPPSPFPKEYVQSKTKMAESKEELKSLLIKVKEESEKADLKLDIQKTKIMASPHFMANRWEKSGNSDRLLFSWAPKSPWIVTAATELKDACYLEEKLWQT